MHTHRKDGQMDGHMDGGGFTHTRGWIYARVWMSAHMRTDTWQCAQYTLRQQLNNIHTYRCIHSTSTHIYSNTTVKYTYTYNIGINQSIHMIIYIHKTRTHYTDRNTTVHTHNTDRNTTIHINRVHTTQTAYKQYT